jgi:hypothetical protein
VTQVNGLPSVFVAASAGNRAVDSGPRGSNPWCVPPIQSPAHTPPAPRTSSSSSMLPSLSLPSSYFVSTSSRPRLDASACPAANSASAAALAASQSAWLIRPRETMSAGLMGSSCSCVCGECSCQLRVQLSQEGVCSWEAGAMSPASPSGTSPRPNKPTSDFVVGVMTFAARRWFFSIPSGKALPQYSRAPAL